MSDQLAVCHECEMIGSVVEGHAHELVRGHDVQILSPEASQQIRDQWADEQADRVVGLVQLARLNRDKAGRDA